MSVLREYAASVAQPTLPFAAFESHPPTALVGAAGVLRYDEVVSPDGALRPAWRALAEHALAITPQVLTRLDGEITRFLADDGVSYVRPRTGPQPWQLDPMPLVLDAPSWTRLEVGLAQRAELLNALLVDLYGDQSLLADGTLPAAAVVGHSGFVRPVARASAFDPHPLVFSAADLGRDAAGEWHVLADRVQAPSGLGFAMENRRVMSQVVPDLLQDLSLHRMEPYFSAVRAALLSAAPEVDDPRVVILSPGTMSETSFDQAFLANALGFPLVQGSDLVVRDGWVWMKPAGWPAKAPVDRIDVIVRRVDAEWCDPLELRSDSQLGVAGLAEAVRRGRVRLANGLGAGVLENPALLPFLPTVCERLLGEQLRIPSVPTWWCGDPEDRAFVLARIAAGDDGLIVRPIDQPRKAVAGLGPDELAAQIEAAPHRYVGQELLPLSQAPTWGRGDRAEALPLTFRAFAVRYGSVYRPLVGGLATLRERLDAPPTTKDVWVLKGDDADPDQGLAEIAPAPTSRSVPALAPRALADMFWSGRYAERAEDLLRLLLTAQAELDRIGARAASVPDDSARVLLRALRGLAGVQGDGVHGDGQGEGLDDGRRDGMGGDGRDAVSGDGRDGVGGDRRDGVSGDGRDAAREAEHEFRALLLDAGRAGTAAHSFARLRDALEGVRDQLSGDTWRVFSNVERAVRALQLSMHPHRTAESAGRMLTAALSLYGVTASMIRDDGWRMIETGRHLERALQVCHLLAVTTTRRRDARTEREVLEALLTASESIVTHRRRYRGAPRIADVLDLLLLDHGNPRSLLFALSTAREHLAAMAGSTGSTRPERLIEDLETELAGLDLAEVAAVRDGTRAALDVLLTGFTAQLQQIAEAIAHLHFESGPPAVPMSALALIEEMARA